MARFEGVATLKEGVEVASKGGAVTGALAAGVALFLAVDRLAVGVDVVDDGSVEVAPFLEGVEEATDFGGRLAFWAVDAGVDVERAAVLLAGVLGAGSEVEEAEEAEEGSVGGAVVFLTAFARFAEGVVVDGVEKASLESFSTALEGVVAGIGTATGVADDFA